MSRADELRARYEAELAVVELEDQLLAAKKTGDVPRELKEQLREARRTYRELRAGDEVTEGDAVVRPATVEATAGVERPGGAE